VLTQAKSKMYSAKDQIGSAIQEWKKKEILLT